MMQILRERLSAKLFVSYLLIVLVGAAVMAFTVQAALPQSFSRHMREMTDFDLPMPGQGRGMGPWMMGQDVLPAEARNLFIGFRAGVTEAMSLAIFAASLVALVVSLVLSRRIVAPLREMMKASERIAAGHYDERVRVDGADELAQLGQRFNQMASQLEQTESMRLRLVGDVSHELRTPLTAIKGYMEGLMDGVLPASAETYEQIHREAGRLSRLVDDLQELSRVESGAYQLDLHPVSVSALVVTVVKRLSLQFDGKQVRLTLSLVPDLPQVLADEDRAIQVLTNLLGNALMYTPTGGTVTISVARAGSEAQISVADTGVGIPAESLPRIFDRFYRVDKSRSRGAGGGSGIGLTVAKALVEAQGGRIWAESAGEGQGSTFSFTLPLAQD